MMDFIKKIAVFILVTFVNFGFSQNVNIKYIGDLDEKCHLSFNYIEFNDDFAILNKINRTLAANCIDYQVISSNDITRRTIIFAECNENIEFYVDKKGLIHYSCKNNPYRKTESEYINKSYEKYGCAETISDKKISVVINNKNNRTENFDEDYTGEKELLEESYKNNLISAPFYNYFKAVYWSLSIHNKLEKLPVTEEISELINKSFENSKYLINIYEYRNLLAFYNEKLIAKNALPFISNEITDQNIIDYLLYRELKIALSQKNQEKPNEKLISLFKEKCKNILFLNEIEEDLLPPLVPIELSEIVEKNKGKVILLDFWASWCMPCREEFPFQKKLIDKYPEVAFVFISIDNNNSVWKKVSKSYSDIFNKNNSFILNKSTKDILLKKINITSIPRYVLFGKDGKIISLNAPRPSSKEIEELIEKNLK